MQRRGQCPWVSQTPGSQSTHISVSKRSRNKQCISDRLYIFTVKFERVAAAVRQNSSVSPHQRLVFITYRQRSGDSRLRSPGRVSRPSIATDALYAWNIASVSDFKHKFVSLHPLGFVLFFGLAEMSIKMASAMARLKRDPACWLKEKRKKKERESEREKRIQDFETGTLPAD